MEIPVRTLDTFLGSHHTPYLPFNIEMFAYPGPEDAKEIHRHNYFQILCIDQGTVQQSIEQDSYRLVSGDISVIFPKQIHMIEFSPGCKGVVIRFDEVLFCSDILKKELSAYNIDLYNKLNYIRLSREKYRHIRKMADNIHDLHTHITPIKKEQIRFYIKILLLQLIEDVHDDVLPGKNLPTINVYARFKELIDEQYTETKTVAGFASQLGLSTKKLNEICKKETGSTALSVIHERKMLEIKRMLLFSGETNKEIAFKLGFASPSALNKFIFTKTGKTPTELKKNLSQTYKQ